MAEATAGERTLPNGPNLKNNTSQEKADFVTAHHSSSTALYGSRPQNDSALIIILTRKMWFSQIISRPAHGRARIAAHGASTVRRRRGRHVFLVGRSLDGSNLLRSEWALRILHVSWEVGGHREHGTLRAIEVITSASLWWMMPLPTLPGGEFRGRAALPMLPAGESRGRAPLVLIPWPRWGLGVTTEGHTCVGMGECDPCAAAAAAQGLLLTKAFGCCCGVCG